MPKPAWEDDAAQEDESLSAMLDPDLETETAIEAATSTKSVGDDSVKSESGTKPEVKKEVQELYDLVESRARVQQLEGRLKELETKQEAKKAAEEDDEVEFDSGEMPEDYKDFKPTFDRAGTVLAKEIAKTRRELKAEMTAGLKTEREKLLADVRAEIAADRIRGTYKIDAEKEKAIGAFADEHGFRTDNPQHLEAVVKLFNKLHPVKSEEQELRPARRPSSNPHVRPTSTSSRTEEKAKPVRAATFDQRMQKSFESAKRQLVNDLKAGKIPT